MGRDTGRPDGTPGDEPASLAELADRVHSAAIHLLRRVRVADAASGLSAARLSALSVLVFGGPRSVGELAATEQVTAPTMSRLVTALERAGFVSRRADPRDARRVRVSATESGRRALEAARARRIEEVASVLAGLSDAERAQLAASAKLLEDALEAAADR